jgi:hypothetical protein
MLETGQEAGQDRDGPGQADNTGTSLPAPANRAPGEYAVLVSSRQAVWDRPSAALAEEAEREHWRPEGGRPMKTLSFSSALRDVIADCQNYLEVIKECRASMKARLDNAAALYASAMAGRW